VPSALASLYVKTMTSFPAYLINFLKFPCVVTDTAFKKAFGYAPERSMRETLADVRSVRDQRESNGQFVPVRGRIKEGARSLR
jgi:hypothetical protein